MIITKQYEQKEKYNEKHDYFMIIIRIDKSLILYEISNII